jgi:NAD-dependent deacetylase
MRDAEVLAETLRAAGSGLILAVTGAGVSAPSGLATFRGDDPGAIWRRDVVEIGTRSYFERFPVEWWRWFLDRFGGLAGARPNPAHHALAALERWQRARGGGFLLVTQNIDTLHEQAGSQRLVQVHGRADRLRCSRRGCAQGAPAGWLPDGAALLAPFAADPRYETLPRCAACGALARAHALLFDEYYDEHQDYGLAEFRRAAGEMAVALFAGTSFSVGVTELVLREALGWRLPVLSIDPQPAPLPAAVTVLRAAAEELLPAACGYLGIPLPS